MKLRLRTVLLLFGFITFLVPEFKLFNLSIIGRMFGESSQVFAQTVQIYIAPVGTTSTTSRTKGAGSRGCEGASDTNLQLLVPEDHIPLTVSEHPTFFWYVSDTSLPVRFTLVEPGVAEPIVDRSFKVKRPGIVQFRLSSDIPGLVLGREYRWTVSLVCNKERPSENTYAYSSIMRVVVTPELARMLATSQEVQKRSLAYAQSGIWYDALLTSYMNYRDNPQGKVASWYFARLLTQIGMPTVSQRQLQQPNIVSSQ